MEKYKKLATTLQDEKKSEIITILSNFVDKLLSEVTLNNKAKEYARHILIILNYSENEIAERLDKDKKKKFGIF